MKLYAFHSGGDMSDKALFDAFDPEVGTKEYSPWFFYLITHPQGNVLFDAGVHPELITDPHARIGETADFCELLLEPGHDAVSQLADVGFRPGDVDVVVLSHLHFDHVSGLELFPDATAIVQEDEYQFATSPPPYQADAYVQSDFAGHKTWERLRGEHDLFGDGQLRLIPTPGHTRGHQSLMVELDEQPVFLLGDATYRLSKMRERLLPSLLWSPDAMIESWELIESLEREHNPVLLYSHDDEFRDRVRIAPDVWYGDGG